MIYFPPYLDEHGTEDIGAGDIGYTVGTPNEPALHVTVMFEEGPMQGTHYLPTAHLKFLAQPVTGDLATAAAPVVAPNMDFLGLLNPTSLGLWGMGLWGMYVCSGT